MTPSPLNNSASRQPNNANPTNAKTGVNWPHWLINARIPILLALHVLIFGFAFVLAFLLRFDFWIPEAYANTLWQTIIPVVSIQVFAFWYFRTIHGWWRYVTFRDLCSFINPLVVSFAIIFIGNYFLPQQIPRSILMVHWILCGLLLAGVRSSWRLIQEGFNISRPKRFRCRAFMISAHHDTLVLANQINSQQNSTTQIVGILCNEKRQIGSSRAGIPILGSMEEAPRLAAKHDVDQVWLIAGSLPGGQLAELKALYDQHGIKTKVIPSATDRNPGSSFIPVREIEIEDLLPRNTVHLDTQRIGNEITGKCVLVTGAGGSIGSEICRQLLKFEPSKLVLVDHRENSVFMIHNELGRLLVGSTDLVPAVADILDHERISDLFEDHSPEFVYHAAAHKHVGLMETQPGVAIRNNITGTRKIAEIANEFGVEKFVMISTDKAVNPTSVMGCTKQIAERYCLSLGEYSKTRYVVARFGNVLGSSGSVVPIFKDQIERGGPITITDERMTRFFMTIPEASQLVLQAGSMGSGGEIFVLDMGEQVKIVDLAKKMIRLAGLPDSAIEIQFKGAGPGEKLYEELYFEEEEMIPTDHEKIFAATHRVLEYNEVLECTSALEDACNGSGADIRDILKAYIPEYACLPSDSKTLEPQEKCQSEIDAHTYTSLRPETSRHARDPVSGK